MFNPELDRDDSLILHTDLYEINMMYTYFKRVLVNAKPFLKYILEKSLLVMVMLYLLD